LLGADSAIGHVDSKITPEHLESILHGRALEHGTAQLCITIPELAVFLGTERYVASMPILLTDLYDCPSVREGGGTITRGTVIHRNVWVSFLSGSTPIWLLKTVNPNVIEGGFTSRCYFIVANEPKRRIPWPIESDTVLWQDMVDDMTMIAQEAKARGDIQLQPAALDAFTKWYRERQHALDPFKQSFEAREDAHILRVAALLCVNDGSWIIKRGHIRVAIRLIADVKLRSSSIFEGAETRSKFAIGLDAMRTMLISAGMDPIPRSRLFQRTRGTLSLEDFNVLLDVLHECKAIQRFMLSAENGRGRKGEWIRGTQLLLARGLGETVLERFTV
jgi:hypothetical protein